MKQQKVWDVIFTGSLDQRRFIVSNNAIAQVNKICERVVLTNWIR